MREREGGARGKVRGERDIVRERDREREKERDSKISREQAIFDM